MVRRRVKEEEVEEERLSVYKVPQVDFDTVFEVQLIPETIILGCGKNKKRLEYYVSKGVIDPEEGKHLDRYFYRDSEGNPIILKHHLIAVIRRACKALGFNEEIASQFDIVEPMRVGSRVVLVPKNYIVVRGKPLIDRSPVLIKDRRGERSSTITYEYLDPVVHKDAIKFYLATNLKGEDLVKFLTALEFGGKAVGLYRGLSRGFGRFKVVYRDVTEEIKKLS